MYSFNCCNKNPAHVCSSATLASRLSLDLDVRGSSPFAKADSKPIRSLRSLIVLG